MSSRYIVNSIKSDAISIQTQLNYIIIYNYMFRSIVRNLHQ